MSFNQTEGFTLATFIVFVLYLLCEKNENKQKEAGFGTFLKTILLIVLNVLSL